MQKNNGVCVVSFYFLSSADIYFRQAVVKKNLRVDLTAPEDTTKNFVEHAEEDPDQEEGDHVGLGGGQHVQVQLGSDLGQEDLGGEKMKFISNCKIIIFQVAVSPGNRSIGS